MPVQVQHREVQATPVQLVLQVQRVQAQQTAQQEPQVQQEIFQHLEVF